MIKIFILTIALWTNVALSERNQFAEFFNSVESLSANFSQTVYSDGFDLLSSTSGNFAFQRPQKLRWHTIKPSEQILLFNNDNELWQIDTELEQAILKKTKDLSKTPLYWLINKPRTLKNTPKFSHQIGGIDWYSAKADKQALEFGFVGGLLNAIKLENELGQIITLTFDNLRVNPNIAQSVFALNLNPDFDIIQ
jgi:outer membrane lipoprotein carrier protein